jgi:hypothetical protein
MKLPRWFVIGTLALTVLLICALGTWWLVAPYQTGVQFRGMLADAEFARANKLLLNGCWESGDHGFLILQSPVGSVSLSTKDWQASVKDAEVQMLSAPLRELFVGTRRVLAKTQFGNLAFTAHLRSVSYDGLLDRGAAGWGLSAGTANTGLLAISGGYSCPDPHGGSISVAVNGEDISSIPAHFGSGAFALVPETHAAEERVAWAVRLLDADGGVRKQLAGSSVVPGRASLSSPEVRTR